MRWGRRFAVLAVMIAALSGVASSQAVGAIFEIANRVTGLVDLARGAYQTTRYMIEATDGVEPPPGSFQEIVDPDERQLRIEEWRYENLARGLQSLQTEVAAAEANIIRTITVSFDHHEQRTWSREAYSYSDVVLIFARQALRRPVSERGVLQAEARQHAQVLTRIAGEAARMDGELGPQFVGGLHAVTQALRALRAIYPEQPDQDTLDYLAAAAVSLDRAADRASSPTSFLRRSATAETYAYRSALNDLAGDPAIRTLSRFRTTDDANRPRSERDYVFQYDRPAWACFETVIATVQRRCRGDECEGNPFRQIDVPTRFRQSRYQYQIARTSVGAGADALHMLSGLRPENLTPQVTESRQPAADCPLRGNPERAWLQTALAYNEGMEAATQIASRAAIYIGVLELNTKTRSELARLQASWRR